MSTNQGLPPDALDHELVFWFCSRFSVLECALKRAGFTLSIHDGVAVDWKRFSDVVTGRFGEVGAGIFHRAVGVLKESQLKRQALDAGGRLVWKDVRKDLGESEEAFVLRLVRTIRNNLFHGGKYPDGAVQQVERERRILRAGLEVIAACYELHPKLARWAEGS
jgi:hypothetical protein